MATTPKLLPRIGTLKQFKTTLPSISLAHHLTDRLESFKVGTLVFEWRSLPNYPTRYHGEVSLG